MSHYGAFVADLPPVAVCELTTHGWRGLTADGEVIDVRGNGKPSDSIAITDGAGIVSGFRTVPSPTPAGTIDDYLFHFDYAVELLRKNDAKNALIEIDFAIRCVPTVRAKFNRALILLSLGRWPDGFAEYVQCETQSIFARPLAQQAYDRGMKLWRGELLAGKRLLLLHDHGFGDTIMMLRYVPRLQDMGAKVIMITPPELERLAAKFATVTDALQQADYFCPMLHLLGALRVTPAQIPLKPYIMIDDHLIDKWLERVTTSRKTVGLAWSVGVPNKDDYPRQIPLHTLVERFGNNAELFSVQQQGAEQAKALGIKTFEFEDFADCAALMMVLDQIVAVDTAALHLAGAIGHPHVDALLSHWHSWRWLSPLYQGINFCHQKTPDDWASALAAI